MERNYYEAYDDRYRQVHSQKLQWFDDEPTGIVGEIISKYQITLHHKLLELGCGEGRDAFSLLNNGFNLLATDISTAAIQYCQKKQPEYADRFRILDCVAGTLEGKFDFIYAVAVVHMLVLDEDRDAFYTFIRNHLTTNGVALICTMGDGETERQTDIRTAFDLQKRTHEQTGLELNIASTSCRMVSFSTFEKELKNNKLKIRETGITNASPDFPVLMYAVVQV
jgi:cyclopropane fatty-acyl-phospholipid synthase-like methyltransferase